MLDFSITKKIAKNALKVRQKREVERTGFWFVDIPRTSSSSVRTDLGEEFGQVHGKINLLERVSSSGQSFDDHLPALAMLHILGRRRWDRIFTFSIVRNPWSRTLSLYHYRRRTRTIPSDWTFCEYVHRLVDADRSTPYFEYFGFRLGCADFICDSRGNVIVDEVIRFEERETGLKRVGDRIGSKRIGSSHIQAASPPGDRYTSAYDSSTRNLIGDFYARDIKIFGWEF